MSPRAAFILLFALAMPAVAQQGLPKLEPLPEPPPPPPGLKDADLEPSVTIIRRGEAYPSDIVEEMRAANLQILEGTLYPLLTRLKNADMLTYRWVESNSGPPRKYFSLTEKGETFYKELEQTWNELYNGVNALTSKKPGETPTN